MFNLILHPFFSLHIRKHYLDDIHNFWFYHGFITEIIKPHNVIHIRTMSNALKEKPSNSISRTQTSKADPNVKNNVQDFHYGIKHE